MVRITETEPVGPLARPPKPESLPRHRREKRQSIVRAALELLEADDYERIQIRMVAERADVALGTVYRYFGSKEHLYAAVMLEWATTYRLALTNTTGGNDAERLKRLMRRAVRAFEKRPQFFRLEIVLESSADEGVRELFDEFSKRHVTVILEALQSLEPRDAKAVADVTNAVLGARLREWALGRATIQEVYSAVDSAVDLIFSAPPPTATSRST
jgi:AcrR family transcriptional regulator